MLRYLLCLFNLSVHAVLTNLVSGVRCDVLTRYVMRLGVRLCRTGQSAGAILPQLWKVLAVLAFYEPDSELIYEFVQMDKNTKIPFSK